ncbi:B2 bradykinin receptor [Lampris incognitus]|uniref:B2 bradykinin receptor n=1 Tax=Lampris incognitus TaxID=2546036 RepID=UPI0024B5896B|nr:B2 bradykinin receptor [Lampris incognitus]XP_056150917.1 B2 bradykinin receptor [Lampris incognitus]
MYNCSNYTEAWQWLSSLEPGYLGLVSIVGMVGNALVLCVLWLQRKPCTVADVYLSNMATADLVMMLCLPFWAVTISRGHLWSFGDTLCKLVNLAISMNYYCSVLFLMLVTVDRYLALAKPMSPSRLRRAAWAKRICLAIWVLGALLSLPVLLFRTVQYVEVAGVEACILAYPNQAWIVQHNITSIVLGFLLPVPVVTYCTYHIVAALREGRANGFHTVRRSERKATHLILAVLAIFLFCWTPSQVMRFLDTLDYFQVTRGCLWGLVLDIGIQLSTFLGYSNSAVNPFLFFIVGKHFRKRAKEVFRKIVAFFTKDASFLTVSFTSVNRLNDTQHISSVKLESLARR